MKIKGKISSSFGNNGGQKQVIYDPQVKVAVNYAAQLIRDGMPPPLAFHEAEQVYNIDRKIINFYVSQRGGRKNKKR